MPLLILTLLFAALVVAFRGGRLSTFESISLRWPLVLPTAVIAQLAAQAVTGPARVPLAVGSHATMALWFVVNTRAERGARRSAFGLGAAGAIANLVPVLRYGGMPVSKRALDAIGAGGVDVTVGNFGKHVLLENHHFGWWLGDVLAVPALRCVVSLGDLVLMAGISVLVIEAGSPSRRGRRLPLAPANSR